MLQGINNRIDESFTYGQPVYCCLSMLATWHVGLDLNNAAVQWGWTVETRPKPYFQIINLAGVD